jgi:hypothetical protein
MKLNFKIKVLSLAVVTVLFSACGSSSTSSETLIVDEQSSTIEAGNDINVATDNLKVDYSVEATSEDSGKKVTVKLGADGDLKAVTDGKNATIVFKDNVVTPYTVKRLLKIEEIKSVTNLDDTTITMTSDFSTGKEYIKGTSKVHGNIDCVNRYESLLPLMISDADELTDIDFDEDTRNSTTCPSWMNEDADEAKPISLELIYNISINENSHISGSISIK